MTILSDIELQQIDNGSPVCNNSLLTKVNDAAADDDDDNLTVIFLETEYDLAHQQDGSGGISNNGNYGNNNNRLPNWGNRLGNTDYITDESNTMFDERRRSILLQELQRIQRRSFLNFVILCCIPVILFIIMIFIVFIGSNENAKNCVSTITYCQLEPRTFVNAFTSRCLCDPIPVERNNNNTLG